MRTVAFHTLGCKLNFAETSAIGRQFLEAGFTKQEFSASADVYVVNTCSVTAQANKKCRYIIRQALKQNPHAYIIVTGCYAQLKPQEIATIPGVDLVLGAADKFRIFEIADQFQKEAHTCVYNTPINEVNTFIPAFSQGDRTRSFLKIQDGCDYKCSFCTIPLARGKSRSDSVSQILQNAQRLTEKGVKEIVLTGVNIGDYGKDQPGTLLNVIQALEEVEGIERYRISSIEPNLLSNEIIAYVSSSKRFMPHFHIPLQSGNNEILAKMRRRYKRELYADRVYTIKKHMPHACIGVDVIVGFPGETDTHFEETYSFLNELEISYLHVFSYSERENTHALTLPTKISSRSKQVRSERLRMLSVKKRNVFYEHFLGTSRDVLWEKAPKNGEMEGFTDNYIKVTRSYDQQISNTIENVYLNKINSDGIVKVRERSPA